MGCCCEKEGEVDEFSDIKQNQKAAESESHEVSEAANKYVVPTEANSSQPPVQPVYQLTAEEEKQEEEIRALRAELKREVEAPKVVDFGELEIEPDQNELTPSADMDAIEKFNVECEESVLERNSPKNTTEDENPPSASWFAERNALPPNVVWYQDPKVVYISISPASATAGWETNPKKIEFNSEIDGTEYAVVLPVYKALSDYKTNVTGATLDIVGKKQEICYWPQLLGGARSAYFKLEWIRKDMSKEHDSDEDEDL